jgi:DNA/RNA-binding domain of Phe-tRNA-synthetase-like protein
VLQQLKSIVFKGKRIPHGAGLVEAMFMAELDNCLLTAGHDYEALKFPLKLDVAMGNEKYVLMNGKEQIVKPGDMMIADTEGIISSIIHGPDSRSRIVSGTQKVVFVVYAPSGISKDVVFDHMSDICAYAKLVSPNATIERQEVYS